MLFIAAQAFQELAYRFWIPTSRGPQDDLLIYLHPIERVRAVLIMATIVGLIVPFIVIGIRYFKVAPLASVLGVIFGAAFIGSELSHRALDFFLIGAIWARQFAAATSVADRSLILQRFAVWNDVSRAWYFPLMLAFLLSSCAFATWTDKDRSRWYSLTPLAFSLNTLRLLARILSTFGGNGASTHGVTIPSAINDLPPRASTHTGGLEVNGTATERALTASQPAKLKEFQDELAFWEKAKKSDLAARCRAEIEALLKGTQQ